MISDHITKRTTAMMSSTGPPLSMKREMDSSISEKRNIKSSIRCYSCAVGLLTGTKFRSSRNYARGLLFQNMDNSVAAALDQCVHQDGRHRHNNTDNGGYQSGGNTTCHDFRITGTEQRDGLEH